MPQFDEGTPISKLIYNNIVLAGNPTEYGEILAQNFFIEDITRANLQTLISSNTLVRGKGYRITNAVGSTLSLVVMALTASTIRDYATNSVTGEMYKYDIVTDTATIIDVVGSVAFGDNNTIVDDNTFASGNDNEISEIVNMGTDPFSARVSGRANFVHNWAGAADGIGNIVDGKISMAFGNSNVCSSNDGVALGNRTWNGRKYYPNITTGSEDAGSGLGVLQYFIIPDVEGDVSADFPNALIDNTFVTNNYGVGAQKDTLGNIYASGFTPAVWSGETLVTANDLTWALHRICFVRGAGETQISYVTIAKVVYSGGTGTKVYYFGAKPYDTLVGASSSYSPAVDINGLTGSNSAITLGLFTSTYGTAALAAGELTRAWGGWSTAIGYKTKALEAATFASGNETTASGSYSQASGDRTIASGTASSAEGILSEASGLYSKAINQQTEAIGQASFAVNRENIANAPCAFVTGFQSEAIRDYQQTYSSGKRSVVGDNQNSKIQYQREVSGVGWFEISLLDNCINGTAYHFNTMIMGRQTGGSAGAVGNTFAYEVKAVVTVSGGTVTTLGTPSVTLIGRSAGMSGDGITTGPRISWLGDYPTRRTVVRYDGQADTTFFIQTFSHIQEIK